MTAARGNRHKRTTFRAKVTGRHAITLPADLCRSLDIQVGDTIEILLEGDHATLRRAPVHDAPRARGVLRGYFSSLEDINRFVAEERQGWDDRERQQLDQAVEADQPH
jgi:bifunctional DNA-binding transcriptional regulator/antitoxin component of YhaV-PrlF toxin-antitoxin module